MQSMSKGSCKSVSIQTKCVSLVFQFPELGGQRWTSCVFHKCFLRATAHKPAEELVSQDPAVVWLGWRSAPALSPRVQTCVSCCADQAAKVEAVEQESCSLSSVNACLGAEGVTALPYLH